MKTTKRLLEAQEYLQSRLVVVRSVYVVAQIGYVWYHKMFKIQTNLNRLTIVYTGNKRKFKYQNTDRLNNICITNQPHCHTSQLAKMSTLQTELDCLCSVRESQVILLWVRKMSELGWLSENSTGTFLWGKKNLSNTNVRSKRETLATWQRCEHCAGSKTWIWAEPGKCCCCCKLLRWVEGALKHWLHLSCTQNGTCSGLFGICSVSQQPPEGTDFTTGTAWKVPHLLPGRGDRHVPQKSCIISSKKNNPKASLKSAEQLRLALFLFFFLCKHKIKKG